MHSGTLCIRDAMPKRPARITQTEVARVIRAAKQAGASEVEVHLGEQPRIIVRLLSTGEATALEKSGDIVL